MKKISSVLSRYRHALIFLYAPIYFIWFSWLQGRNVTHTIVYSELDALIPFCEYFVIPYLLWFLYIGVTMAWLFFRSQEYFLRYCEYLFIGMTICLIIYTLWPNMQNLRPEDVERDNIFIRLIRMIWGLDPSSNVCPSIHVYNAIGTHAVIRCCPELRKKKGLGSLSLVLCVLIMMSTVLIKQHTILDVAAAMLLAIPMYPFAYRRRGYTLQKYCARDRAAIIR